MTNTSSTDPLILGAVNDYRARLAQQQGRETGVDPNLQAQIQRLGTALSDDTTQRQTERAVSRARDAAAGMAPGLSEALSRRGVSGGGYEGRRSTQIGDSAARAGAKAAADIEMGERARKDALILGGQGIMAAPGQERLARETGVNAMYGTYGDLSTRPAEFGLRSGDLGLRQWEAQNRLGLDRAGLETRQWESANRLGLDRARLDLDAQLGVKRSEQDDRNQMIREWETMMRAAGY